VDVHTAITAHISVQQIAMAFTMQTSTPCLQRKPVACSSAPGRSGHWTPSGCGCARGRPADRAPPALSPAAHRQAMLESLGLHVQRAILGSQGTDLVSLLACWPETTRHVPIRHVHPVHMLRSLRLTSIDPCFRLAARHPDGTCQSCFDAAPSFVLCHITGSAAAMVLLQVCGRPKVHSRCAC
jgi:hypothetical protein